MKMILESPDERVEPELIALGINLACNKRNAQLICQPRVTITYMSGTHAPQGRQQNIANMCSASKKRRLLVAVRPHCMCRAWPD